LVLGAFDVENRITINARPVNPVPRDRLSAGQCAAVARAVPTAGTLHPVFDGLARLAASVCQAPLASIVITGCGEAWCSSNDSLPLVTKAQHEPLFAYTSQASEVFEIEDISLDKRFLDTECLGGTLAVRSYAGCPLRTAAGEVLGTLAVFGTTARQLLPEQRRSLLSLAQQAVAQIELRVRVAELELLPEMPLATRSPPAEASAGSSGFFHTIGEVTDLATARGNLERAETLFRDTFEQAPVGIAYADRAGRFLRCNQTFCAMLDFGLDEIQGRSIVDITYGEDVACTSRELERLWSGETDVVDIEKRYTRKDGNILWVRVTTALVREGNATPERSVEFLRDISTRKKLAAELLQQQTLLEAVITDLPVALLACDVAGHITHYNRAAADLHRIPTQHPSAQGSSEPLALTAEVYLADGVTPVSEADHPLARALRGETISNLELVVVPRAATPRTTLSSARRLIGPDGQTLGAVAVIQDTTERKLSELELERVHKQLMTASRQAGMAEIATNVLHNVGNILNSVNISLSLVTERVKQSNAPGLCRVATLLKEKGQHVGEFITSDEHGKQLPTYLATLGEQLMTNQRMALQELASLHDNLEHIKSTVAMQQNYAKLCGVTETVAVVDLVEDSLRLNAGAFARHGVTICREFVAVPPITVDKHKVLQILVNLVRNAKYACDESGKADKLLTLRVEPASNAVRICVVDNGVGISAENIDRLFTHGFTTRQSGHGFGLHSAALAAQELGGSLRAESDGPGRGAAFILELPCEPAEGRRA
jgi:PAS domain S-box-containing protein